MELNNNILKINLKEYPIVNQLIIIGEKSTRYKEQIKKIIKLREKRSFIKSYLVGDIEKIKNLYSSAGYNSSNVEIKIKEINKESFDLLIEIDRGQQTKIASINFIGNNSIRSNRPRDVIAGEEDNGKNTKYKFRGQLNKFDQCLRNYHKSLYFYDVKINLIGAAK